MTRSITWALALTAASISTTAFAGVYDALDVRLTLASPVVRGDSDIPVTLSVTNVSGRTVSVLKWQLPSEGLRGPLLKITREDGTAVPYVGPMVKRAAPTAADYVRIEPGATLNYQIELTGTYELGNGRYTIEYIGRGARNDSETLTSSTPLYLWTEGRTPAPAAVVSEALGSTLAASITYTGNCTSSQKSALATAVTGATNYATSANSYLSGTGSGTQRYVKWFGSYTSSRWATARTHFTNVQSAFTSKPLTLDCSCTDQQTYAYVYPNQPYKIYLCGVFWSAPQTGTDSKAGTLVHEMSHFTVVAGTDDWAYGQSAAASLALTNPTKALDNADSHEYFAENTPALP